MDIGTNHQSYWLSAAYLHLGGIWEEQWIDYVKGLTHGGIRLKEVEDTLLWMHNKVSSIVSASKAYDLIVSTLLPLFPVISHSRLWYCNVSLKIKCFSWLCIENRINTWNNLEKKDGMGQTDVAFVELMKNLLIISLLVVPLFGLSSTFCTDSLTVSWFGMIHLYWVS